MQDTAQRQWGQECQHCGTRISTTAHRCPYCKMRLSGVNFSWLHLVVGILVITTTIGSLLYFSSDRANAKEAFENYFLKEISYWELTKISGKSATFAIDASNLGYGFQKKAIATCNTNNSCEVHIEPHDMNESEMRWLQQVHVKNRGITNAIPKIVAGGKLHGEEDYANCTIIYRWYPNELLIYGNITFKVGDYWQIYNDRGLFVDLSSLWQAYHCPGSYPNQRITDKNEIDRIWGEQSDWWEAQF